ncbi:MAG: hypothetical protein GX981_03540 [Tissierellia bacterium]|nr:hypothetical protein [Tissierellia bacterium]
MTEINMDNMVAEIFRKFEKDCLIVDKVFCSCQQRKCFPKVEVDLDGNPYKSIKFKPGFIVPNTLVITDIENRANFKRVRFTLRIPYEIKTKSEKTIERFLPDILKDIVLFIPDARDEFEFKIVVETSSSIIGKPIRTENILSFAVGTFIIIKVVGKVQLLVPTFGYCPEPDPCEEFSPESVCDEFDYYPFPDFFPPQFNDIIWDD